MNTHNRWSEPDLRLSSRRPLNNEQLETLAADAKRKRDEQSKPLTDLVALLINAGLPRPAAQILGNRITALEAASTHPHLREVEKRA